MREVNNNPDFGKIPQRQDNKINKLEDTIEKTENVIEEKILSTFDNPKAAFLGRSQINNIDALKNDITFGIKHPDAIEKADKFFDIAFKQLQGENHPNAYAKASELTAAYVNEFHE